MNKYIPIYEYAKLHNVPLQNVYRWIRERRIDAENVKKEVITKEVFRILADTELPAKRKVR